MIYPKTKKAPTQINEMGLSFIHYFNIILNYDTDDLTKLSVLV
jgi:hypothetical protein